jgi:hypothetical protein
MNLPLSVFLFPFVICVSLIFPNIFSISNPFNVLTYGQGFAFATDAPKAVYNVFLGPDFFMLTLLTFMAPILCFIIELASRPLYLLRFLCHSTVLYAGLCALSTVGVLTYLATGKATFLVTGDQSAFSERQLRFSSTPTWWRIKSYFQSFLYRSHPDHSAVKSFEIACGLFLICYSLFSSQISLIGLALAFILLPVMHHVGWENPIIQRLVLLPFFLTFLGLLVRGLTLFLLGGFI